ncbi:RBBP9/YdeN family alpha/beta hydrolase [Fibrella aquatilis]|uniref:Alpha/beta hydrolase n=1 Tax=Fibrella aquatilis TaxID=2817059 RepID=A0A939G943_9BACT|nr:alpha/beta hydrolase [Fibrella aquatilis]MBO0932088.1 alpha/beta hydrolase [Fibrella aquatilis]
MNFNAQVLIIPGLGSSGPQHWQSLWEDQFPEFQRVHQQDWITPVRQDWVNHLDHVVMAEDDPGNVILVGHSLACTTIAYWARKYQRLIKGALLVAPSDTEASSYPPGTEGFVPIPLMPLPFPSIVVASTNDEYVTLERATQFARAWGSELVNIGPAGHINASSNLGRWPAGLVLLKRLDV